MPTIFRRYYGLLDSSWDLVFEESSDFMDLRRLLELKIRSPTPVGVLRLPGPHSRKGLSCQARITRGTRLLIHYAHQSKDPARNGCREPPREEIPACADAVCDGLGRCRRRKKKLATR